MPSTLQEKIVQSVLLQDLLVKYNEITDLVEKHYPIFISYNGKEDAV